MKYSEIDELSAYKYGNSIVYILDSTRGYDPYRRNPVPSTRPSTSSTAGGMLVLRSKGNMYLAPDFTGLRRPSYGIVDFRAGKEAPEGWFVTVMRTREIEVEWDFEMEMAHEEIRKKQWDAFQKIERDKRRAQHIKNTLREHGVSAMTGMSQVSVDFDGWDTILSKMDPKYTPAK